MKIFISYAREDLETAKKLRDDLEKAGIKTWLDKEDLLPGQKWRTIISKEIRECSSFSGIAVFKIPFNKGLCSERTQDGFGYARRISR
jgi:hypothetical protein